MGSSVRHVNNGKCPKCDEIFSLYAYFHHGLRVWFNGVQELFPEAHISNAGRGRYLQENYFKRGLSRAHYGESSHNYNAGIDIFRLTQNGAEYGPTWFRNVIGEAVEKHNADPLAFFKIEWYGAPGAKFFELPHCEVQGWKFLGLSLVEKNVPQSNSAQVPQEKKKALG